MTQPLITCAQILAQDDIIITSSQHWFLQYFQLFFLKWEEVEMQWPSLLRAEADLSADETSTGWTESIKSVWQLHVLDLLPPSARPSFQQEVSEESHMTASAA